MKEEREEISAIGRHMTMMIELIIIRMLQPMKDMMNELKSDVESIKAWCAEYISVEKFNELVISMQDMKSDVELSINEAINSLGMPTLPQLNVMFSDIEGKVSDLDDRIDEFEDKINDFDDKNIDLDYRIDELNDSRINNESKIEDIENNVDEMVSKLGLIGDILND